MMREPVKFIRYTNPKALAGALGPCPRCNSAIVTGSVWTVGGGTKQRFRLTCDSEQCIAEAVRLVKEGQGI